MDNVVDEEFLLKQRRKGQPRCKCGLIATFPEHDYEIKKLQNALTEAMRRQDELQKLTQTIHLRAELRTFAQAMELKLRMMDHKYEPDQWRTDPLQNLRVHLEEELAELAQAQTKHDEMDELVDVANMSMFVWNRRMEERP